MNLNQKISLSRKRIEKIREKFNESKNRFSKSKIKEIRRNLYKIKKQKNLSTPEIKEIEINLLDLEKNLFQPRKYYNYDDIECRGTRDVKNLLDLLIDENCYKPIRTNSAFHNNYIQYEIKGGKDKISSFKEYLNMIRPHSRDIINDHKTQREWKLYSGNAVIDYKTQVEWKIQLTMVINFISSAVEY